MSEASTPGPVLVTGAGGFIGRAVVRRLAATGLELHGASRNAPSLPELTESHALDLLDGEATEALLAEVRPSRLVHLAWTTAHGAYWTDEANLDWMAATLSLLRGFARHGGRRAVLVGSCTEYDWSMRGPFVEDRIGGPPETFYGACKLATGLAACAWGEAAGVPVAWGRIFHLYGPDEDPRRIVPQLIAAADQGQPLELRQPHNLIDYLHVDDVAGALVAILRSDLTGPCNVGSGHGVTPAELGDVIGELAGSPAYRVPERIDGDPREIVADVGRLRDEVGFSPERNLHEGLRETRDRFLAREKGTRV